MNKKENEQTKQTEQTEQTKQTEQNMPLRLPGELVNSYASRCVESGIEKFNSVGADLQPSISQGRHYIDVNDVLNNLGKHSVFLESGVYIWHLYHSFSGDFFAFWENHFGFFGWFKLDEEEVYEMFKQ